MKKTNVPKGIPLFRLGIALSILALSSCMEIADDSDLVTVRVNIPGKEETRSLNLAIAQVGLNFYEIVFMDTTSKACYSGTTDGSNALTVAIPPGTYSILLLGGDYQDYQGPGIYVLLATGYIASKTITAAGPNVIDFGTTQTQFKAIVFDPGIKNNITIDYTNAGASTGWLTTPLFVDRKAANPDGTIPTFTIPRGGTGGTGDVSWSGTSTDNIWRIKATLTFDYLTTAMTASGNTAIFQKQELNLRPIKRSEPIFNQVITTGNKSTGFEAQPTDMTVTKKATVEFQILSEKMPNIDSYGGMYFELLYRAFSFDTSKTIPWRIRGGLDYSLDAKDPANVNNRGGAVMVKIGDGGRLPTDGTIVIDMGSGSFILR